MFGTKGSVVGDPFGVIRDQLEQLAAEDRAGLPSAVLSDQVLALFAVVERAQAELLRCVGQWDAVTAWADDGAVSPVSWLAERAPVTRPEASRVVRSARLCRNYEHVGHALARGAIKVSHVETLTSAERHRSSVFADHETSLVDLAPSMNPSTFVTAMQFWSTAADDLLARPDRNKKYEHRFFKLNASFEANAHADGFFDAEAAAIIRAALDAHSGRPDSTDSVPRTQPQRWADALVELCRASLAGALPDRHVPSAVDVVINLRAFTDPNHDPLRDPMNALGELNGHPVGRPTLERLCCDTVIGRVVMNGESEVLDLGRRSRRPSAAMYRALVRRDQHCRFPECDRPPQWTDAHHLVHWIHGGPTNLDNLVLLCRRHHMLCHEGGWQLRREPDGRIAAGGPRAWHNWRTERAPPQHQAA